MTYRLPPAHIVNAARRLPCPTCTATADEACHGKTGAKGKLHPRRLDAGYATVLDEAARTMPYPT